MFTDDDRRELYDALEEKLGPRPAATLMALLPPVGWADVATRADLEAYRVSLQGEMAVLRGELKGEMAELRGEVHSLLPKLFAANLASMIGVAGLMMAAFSIAN